MKCLQLMDSYNEEGGMERFVFNFSQKIQNRKIHTVLATLRHEDTVTWGLGDINIVDICHSDRLEVILDFKPDLIIWHLSYETAGIIEKLAQKIPTIATVHGVMCPSGARLFRDKDTICWHKSGQKCLWNWYVHRCGYSFSPIQSIRALKNHQKVLHALKKCERIYVVSNAIREFMSIEGISERKIKVFDNTLGKFKGFPPLKVVKPKSKLNVLYIGRLVYAKGVQYLVSAIAKLSKAGANVHLDIAGDGWYKSNLQDLVVSLGMECKVTFLGKIAGDRVGNVYENADVVVVPSIWPEPAGLVVPEARSYGKPVIVFNAGGLPEWADLMDGVCFARHADLDDLCEKLKWFVRGNSNELQRSYSHSCQRVDLVEDIENCLFRQIDNPSRGMRG